MPVRTDARLNKDVLAKPVIAAWAESLERRLLFAAGDLDAGFGTGGTVVTSFGAFSGTGATPNDLLVQSDGRIVVAGSNLGQSQFALVRYAADGTPDASFGSSGVVTTNTGSGGTGIAIDGDSNYVVTGLGPATINRTHAAAFYNPDGTLNTALDGDGVKSNFGGHKIAIVDGNRWVFGSATGLEVFDVNSIPANYPNGNGATSFVNDMAITTDPLTGNKQVIAVGYSRTRTTLLNNTVVFTSRRAISRYNIVVENHKASLELDTTFGVNGRVTAASGGANNGNDDFLSDNWHSVAIQNDGSIVVVGNFGNTGSGTNGFVMSRYLRNGQLDTDFGTAGSVTLTQPATGASELSAGTGVVIQPADGKIIVSGNGLDSNGDPIATVARYDTKGVLDLSFSTDGYSEISSMANSTGVAIGTDGNAIVIGTAAGSGDAKFAVSSVETSTPVPPASGSASVINNVLVVAGTTGNDAITLSSLNVSTVRVTVNGSNVDFDPSTFSSIQVSAGTGNDSVLVGTGVQATYVNGGAGNDKLTGGDNNDTLTGGTGNDLITGGSGNDLVNGYGGDDSLEGGSGNDVLRGHDGRDLMTGNAGDDSLDGGSNPDTLNGGSGNDTLLAGGGNDLLNGNSGIDSLFGGAGDDIMFSLDTEADTLNGDAGNDTATQFDVSIDVLNSIEVQS